MTFETTPYEIKEAIATAKAQGRDRDAEVMRCLWLETRRLDWLDKHCAFVADEKYNIGPFSIGELRQMADAGLAADFANARAEYDQARNALKELAP